MVVRMRHTKSHTANRRSHHALKPVAMVKCANCGALKISHKVCETCGVYRGKKIIDVAEKVAKKQARTKVAK